MRDTAASRLALLNFVTSVGPEAAPLAGTFLS
jgi:hypothetical protein